jgi:6,7-dimethyl-8-ribityllumazine synthase
MTQTGASSSPRDYRGDPRRGAGPLAIVAARYNEAVTTKLVQGALETLAEFNVPSEEITLAWVPGAWELPVVAQQLARSTSVRAIICLAAVIRGETSHDQYINQQVSHSLGQIALETGIPTLFGVLTCQTLEQAIQRSGGRAGNKGSECARAALEMIDLLQQLPGGTLHSPQSAEISQPNQIHAIDSKD